MKASVYNISTGQIVRIIQCDASDLHLQISDGQSFVEGEFDDSIYYIENQLPVAFPEKPIGSYVFDWNSKQWMFDSIAASELAKSQRDKLLSESDWTQMPDVQMADEKRNQWKVYRQSLRDITLQPDFPKTINWPVKPE